MPQELFEVKNPLMVHFATGANSACGVHICGGTFYTEKNKLSWNRPWYKPILHSCDTDQVTCKRCRKSAAFKNAVKGA